MRRLILARYILREHVGPFLFGFTVITLIFLLNLMFRELSRMLSKGLPWHVVAEFFVLNLAWIVALAVPMAVLMATLMAFGRLAADNEITAMKASGISLYRVITPVLISACLVTAAMIWFNNEVLPDMNHRARLLAGDIARKQPGVSIEPGVWYDRLPNYGLLVQSLEDSVRAGNRQTGITMARNMIISDHTDPERSRTLSARRGYMELSSQLGALVLTLFDGEMQEIDIRKPEEFRRVLFTKHVLAIAVDDMFLHRSESEYRGDREKSAQQMRLEIVANRRQIAENGSLINEYVARDLHRLTGATFGIAGKVVDSLLAQTPASWRENQNNAPNPLNDLPQNVRVNLPLPRPAPTPISGKSTTLQLNKIKPDSVLAKERRERGQRLMQNSRQTLSNIDNQLAVNHSFERSAKSLQVEVHKKYSIPVASLVFVIIGAPLGFMARRGGLAAGGGLSLGFFLIYWAFLIGGEDLADRQYISPFTAMWAANFVVGAFGLFLLWRAAQENLTLELAKFKWWGRTVSSNP